MITAPEIKIATARMTGIASGTFNSGVPQGELLITSKVPGLAGNRVSVTIRVDEHPGPPGFVVSGRDVTFRSPRRLTFEASGAFLFEGAPVTGFTVLWYSGEFNDRESFATDGLPVSWPLTRNGEFTMYADGAWHMIRREAGAEVMHWKSDSTYAKVILVPSGDRSETNPTGWYGVAPGCTGWVAAHYGSDHNAAEYIPYFLEGDAGISVPPNPDALALLDIVVAPGNSGSGIVLSAPRQRLSGGK